MGMEQVGGGMKTITFYSYKGGVGRSLALANTVRYLRALGRNVFALDLDFEAPGLHYKLLGEEVSTPSLGALDLLEQLIAGEDCAVRGATLEVEAATAQQGWVRLMPAGAAPTPAYWSKLASMNWQCLFHEGERIGVLAFMELRELIREAYSPDYLLIDARTGITEVGGAAISLLADQVVAIGANNAENKAGLRTVLHSIRRVERPMALKAPEVFVAVSRIPTGLAAEDEAAVLDAYRDALNATLEGETLGLQEVFVLHSLPALTLRERLLLSDEIATDPSALFDDYVRLLARILRHEDFEASTERLVDAAMKRFLDDPDGVRANLETFSRMYPSVHLLKALLKLYSATRDVAARLRTAERLWQLVGNAEDLEIARAFVEGIEHKWSAEFGLAVWHDQPDIRSKIRDEVVRRLICEGYEDDARTVVGDGPISASVLRVLNDLERSRWVLELIGVPESPLPEAIAEQWARAALRGGDAEDLAQIERRAPGLLGRMGSVARAQLREERSELSAWRVLAELSSYPGALRLHPRFGAKGEEPL